MTIIIKPISLDDVYANDRICYNTNNHWKNNIRPENYDEIIANGHTNKWINQFRTYKKIIINTKQDLYWMKQAYEIGSKTKRFPHFYDDELDDNKLDDDKLDDNKLDDDVFDDDVLDDNNKVTKIDDILVIGETTFEKINHVNVCRDITHKKTKLKNDVQVLSYLDNNDYDELLNKNIVFINLVDASAVNTVIECVVRNTPIIVNKLPALVEILGDKYPLFYDNVDDVNFLLDMTHLENGYNYLKKLNKNEFKMETFINKFELILEDIKLNTNESNI